MTMLDEICDRKRDHVADRKSKLPLTEIRERLKGQADKPRGFVKALEDAHMAGSYGLICEIKKASPSRGLIRPDFHPESLAVAYEAGGATCLSVLTDQPYFQGADHFLQEVRKAVPLPVLRKDFMIDLYQIDESRLLGADCILLILSALEDSEAADMEARAFELGMDVLIEVHDAAELERAKKLKSPLVGINNRNLKTMEQSLDVSKILADHYPEGRIRVSESSLSKPEDLIDLEAYGFQTFLIGETFMRQADVTAAVQQFQRKPA